VSGGAGAAGTVGKTCDDVMTAPPAFVVVYPIIPVKLAVMSAA
jgi:hypothetical protein